MPFDPDGVETVTVDSDGTLVDPEAATTAIAAVVDDPEPIVARWRGESLSYVMVVDAVDEYRPLDELIGPALEQVLGAHGIETTAAEGADIMATWDDLDPSPDVREGLESLATTFDVYVLSMGTPAMLDSMLAEAGIDGVVAAAISLHEIRRQRFHAAVYRHAADRTDTPIDGIAHVAGPSVDVRGAMAAGMQGVWIDRTGAPRDPCFRSPDLLIETFHDIVDVPTG